MARPRKPLAAKMVAGTYRPDRDPAPTSGGKGKAPTGPPKCPSWLGKVARGEWRRVVALLGKLVTQADMGVLTIYCTAYQELREATEILARDGRTTTTAAGGVKPHPALAMQRTAMEQLRQASGLLGLDPATRSKLGIQLPGPKGEKKTGFARFFPEDDDDRDDLEEFLNGR